MALSPFYRARFVEILVDGSSHSKICTMADTTPTHTINHSTSPYSSDSDDDVLRAVLEYVESFDGHSHDPVPIRPTVPQPSASPPSTRKRHSSERIRAEIEALRTLASQLEDHIAHLQFERVARTNAARSASPAPSGWEIEALHQEEQRLAAEMENLHLKAVVEAQAKVAQRLEVLFERRVRHQGQDDDAIMDDHSFLGENQSEGL